MGSVGTPEILLILVIALLLFGPQKLPELGKSLGRAIREFKRASQELQETIEKEVEDLKSTGEGGSQTSVPKGTLPAPSFPPKAPPDPPQEPPAGLPDDGGPVEPK
jgi:TatA/E family protein of Tat protein translocase